METILETSVVLEGQSRFLIAGRGSFVWWVIWVGSQNVVLFQLRSSA